MIFFYFPVFLNSTTTWKKNGSQIPISGFLWTLQGSNCRISLRQNHIRSLNHQRTSWRTSSICFCGFLFLTVWVLIQLPESHASVYPSMWLTSSKKRKRNTISTLCADPHISLYLHSCHPVFFPSVHVSMHSDPCRTVSR